MSAAFEQTIANQRRAATPVRSAFVSANAGSGKTRVLTDRVARLLLAGTDPAKILCITFTKAAAAEMADRLFKLLGQWALEDDAALGEALAALEGGAKTRSADDLARARRLFARALETPGGLKIQTIHSFCETVLKRFPLEAGVAPGFSVLEESAAAHLAAQAINIAALEAGDHDTAAAFARLSSRYAPPVLRGLLTSALLSRQGLSASLEKAGDWPALLNEVAAQLCADPNATEKNVRGAILDEIDRDLLAQTGEIFSQGLKTAHEAANGPLASYFSATGNEAAFTALTSFFMTKSGTPRKKFGDKQTNKLDPSLPGKILQAQEKFCTGIDQIKTAAIYQDTKAYYHLVQTGLHHYERLKARRAGLDYDDLIIATRRLLQDKDKNAWVMYKLDYGLDHILLDEAQDTSPGQWDIVESPLEEFFSGAGARDHPRTFFAVGDQKQSIYSFQGADAGLFAAKQLDLGEKISAATDFENVPLTLSFRTTAPVLQFVDALFEDRQALEGLADTALTHGVFREGEAGLVALWPLTPQPEKIEFNAWDAPVDARIANSPAKTLCDHVAATIKNWIGVEDLKSKGRPIAAGDVIILVQSRGPLFHQMIASLARMNVPVAGADKLKLLDDPAVEDLMSYARAVLLPTDDLSLAEILKSPFFGVDDSSLFDLAHGRRGALWGALSARAGEHPEWRRALEEITEARRIGLTEGAYAFFQHLLEEGAPSGRKRLYQRLSAASREPIDEFLRQALEFERTNPRSLHGFISWAAQNAGEIKREMEQGADAVRVMTVHGAKGLEGEIVFLLDAHRRPNLQKLGPLFEVHGPAEKPGICAPVLLRSKADASATAEEIRETAVCEQYEEYRRLLYVAATRARDRLYICGLEGARAGNNDETPIARKSWHGLCTDAFERLAHNAASTPHDAWAGQTWRLDCPQEKPAAAAALKSAWTPTSPPDWLFKMAPAEKTVRRLAPSHLADHAEAQSEPAAYSPLRPQDTYFRGRVLHRLLELLPQLPSSERAPAASVLLTRLAPDISPAEATDWIREVMAVITDPDFAPAFGPGSQAEIAIAGTPPGADADCIIAGQIDRLAVSDSRILVIDYKTNRPPPQRAEDVAETYLTQMAAYRALLREIYPERSIETALLWTFEARLMALPDHLLDHAFARNLA